MRGAQHAAATASGGDAASAGAHAGGDAAGALEALRRQPKHVFVFSTAGKPVYSYCGAEEELAGVMAAAQAILSVVQGKGQGLRYVRAGHQVLAFLERPPLCLVGVSSLAEPPTVLRMQLSLVHGQIVSLLTSSALSSIFKRTPGYDMRKLLGGGDAMLTSLIDSFLSSPAALLGAYPSLPLLPGVRGAVSLALAAALRASRALFGLVASGRAVVAAAAAPSASPLAQWDVLLLLNFLSSSEGFRRGGEALAPICLPQFNPAANVHAYVCYTDPASETVVALLAGGAPDFAALLAARAAMQRQLEYGGALQAVVQAAAEHRGTAGSGRRPGGAAAADRSGPPGPAPGGGTGHVPHASSSLLDISRLPPAAGGGAFGSTPLLHFVYKLSTRQQFVTSPLTPQLEAMELQQPLTVALSQLRAAMYDPGDRSPAAPLQRARYEARPRFVLFGAASPEAELYLALDPLAGKAEAEALAGALGTWLRTRHDLLFQAG